MDVRLLVNASLLLDTSRPLKRFFAESLTGGGHVEVRGVSRFPQLLHAKMAIIDGEEAFLLGSPFVNGYWDTPSHVPIDARRPRRELAGRPVHDLSVRVTGPAVGDLEAVFSELWDDVAVGSAPRRATHRVTPVPHTEQSAAIRVVRTTPRHILSRRPQGETSILDACLTGIARARSLIYVEHQYLSARRVVSALAEALVHAPDLEIVIVLNQNPDVTAYRQWQNARLIESGLLTHPRVGVFALWSAQPNKATARMALTQVFVHSKVLLVDDLWATVGTANLDGVSLYSYGDDFDSPLARRLFRHVRNFDLNLVVDERGEAHPALHHVSDLRRLLWQEHLGQPDDAPATRPSSGWLAVWHQRAAHNISALNAGAHPGGPCPSLYSFALPYSVRPTPAAQLHDIGLRLESAAIDLCFDPGWLEVHASPSWIRNMFT
ncbi:MAG: hypothetical protein NVS4B3_27070 [Gemmatimonadaceae bacterium]